MTERTVTLLGFHPSPVMHRPADGLAWLVEGPIAALCATGDHPTPGLLPLPTLLPLPPQTHMQATVRAYMATHTAALLDSWRAMANRVEVILSTPDPARKLSTPTQPKTGADWLHRRRSARQSSDAVRAALQAVRAGLGPLAENSRLAARDDAIDLSLLVPRASLEQLRRTLPEALSQAAWPTAQPCRATGPWPPFSFVSLPRFPAEVAAA